jgi:POLQ-like helicase
VDALELAERLVTGKEGCCLARHDLCPQNIICEDVADYVRQEQKRLLGEDSFPLHKYLHHGLSSQAMAFNLIGP